MSAEIPFLPENEYKNLDEVLAWIDKLYDEICEAQELCQLIEPLVEEIRHQGLSVYDPFQVLFCPFPLFFYELGEEYETYPVLVISAYDIRLVENMKDLYDLQGYSVAVTKGEL